MLAIVVFAVFLIPFLAIMIRLSFDFGKEIFFVQKRVGKNEKTFSLIKFRTMKGYFDGDIAKDDDRTTPFGEFLRKFSLDELPQIINIFKGEMSWVGPRPLLVEYLPHYSPEEKKRHLVKPGISGWAQVNGRNAINWDKRLALDVEYVKKQSFFFDLKILMLTFGTAMKGTNVNYPENSKIKFSDFAKKRNSTQSE